MKRIKNPDRLFMRLSALVAAALWIYLVFGYGVPDGTRAFIGWVMLVGAMGWVAAYGTTYDTKWEKR